MKEVKRIVEEYRDSDFDKRLSIFLEHRSLRDEFMEMEQPLQTAASGASRSIGK